MAATYLRRWEFAKGTEPTFDALKESFEEMLKALELPDVHMWEHEGKLVFRGTGPYMFVVVELERADGKVNAAMTVAGKGEQIRPQDLEKYFIQSIAMTDRFLASMDRAEQFRQRYLTRGAAFGAGAIVGTMATKAVVGSVKLVAKGVRALLRDQEAYDKELAFYLRVMGIGDLVVGGKDSYNLTPILKKQAEQENVLAQYQLGVSYSNGIGVAANEDEAIRWFERAAAHGELRSKNMVAGAWLYGEKAYPIEKKQLGIQYLVDLAASGETWAPAQIIDIYKDGTVSGIPADYDKMVGYAEMYADQGYLYAAHILAEVNDTARGPAESKPYKDDTQAAFLYNMILGNDKCSYTETAAMCLADMYRTGRGVEENPEQAIACYRQASSYGNMEAKLAMVELFCQTLENEERRAEIRDLARQLKGSGRAPLNAAAVYALYRVEDAEEQYGKAMKLARQYVTDPCADAQKAEEATAYLAKMEERISQMPEDERRAFLKERKPLFRDPAMIKGLIFGGVAIALIVLALCLVKPHAGQRKTESMDTIEAWEEVGDPYATDVFGETILIRDVDDDYVNLREGPGTEYDIITSLPNGSWAQLGEGVWDDRWTYVMCEGNVGWVHSDFVHDLSGVIRNNSNTGCNVRQGPGTDYDIIGYLYNGEYVVAHDTYDDEGWFCIEYDGGIGWISGGFWHDGMPYVYNADNEGANFRAEPNTESDVLAFIYNDTLVIPMGALDEGEWVHVQYDGMLGWVYRDFIRYSGRWESDVISETLNVFDDEQRVFDDTYWRFIVGFSNSGACHIKFHGDGTYDGFHATTGMLINGVYSYDGETLVMDGDHPYWEDGRIEFCYDETEEIFTSVESIELHGSSFRYALWPDEDGFYQEMYEQSASEYRGAEE